jgi:hypothetical protein
MDLFFFFNFFNFFFDFFEKWRTTGDEQRRVAVAVVVVVEQ